MPNGRPRPSAKTAPSPARFLAPEVLKTRMRPAPVSATNTSPFGATRMTRGSASPCAKSSTAKPGGAFGACPSLREFRTRRIGRRAGGERRRQILRRNQALNARSIRPPVAERRGAAPNTVGGKRSAAHNAQAEHEPLSHGGPLGESIATRDSRKASPKQPRPLRNSHTDPEESAETVTSLRLL